MEGNVIGRPSFCGAAKISLGDLAPEAPSNHIGTYTGRVPWANLPENPFEREDDLCDLCIFCVERPIGGA